MCMRTCMEPPPPLSATMTPPRQVRLLMRCFWTRGMHLNKCLISLEVHHRLHRSSMLQHRQQFSKVAQRTSSPH